MRTFFRNAISKAISTAMVLGIIQMASAQCIPGFLGPENVGYILCSPTAQIDYVNLFHLNASYNPILLPPNDTIRQAGQPDKIVTNQIKYLVIATLPNGCKDSAIVRVPFNIDPYPNLGRDTGFIICRGATKDISHLYDPGTFSAFWSLPNPETADTGLHYISIQTRDGCRDSAFISITHFPYILLGPDTLLARRPGETVDLHNLFDTAHLSLTWSTNTPKAAVIGTYWVIGLDSNQCRDTAIADICQKPDLGKDTTIKVCPGLTRNLYGIYPLGGLLPEFNTFTPSAVGAGSYRLIVTNYCGGKDTANIQVVAGVKPVINTLEPILICENETSNIFDLFPLAALNLVGTWSVLDPERAPVGIHSLTVTNTDGCQATTFIEINSVPKKPYYNDTTVYVCGGATKDLNQIFPFSEDAIVSWVNAPDEANATAGEYNVIIYEEGCQYNLKVTVSSQATKDAFIGLCTFNMEKSGFSTNDFRSVIVDKEGTVWAGADGNGTSGGLYRFNRNGSDCIEGTWTASTKYSNSSYRDLHLSPLPDDNSIWCASNGYNFSNAISGGVYKINSINDVKRYGASDEMDGHLSSRFVNSLAISPNANLYAGLAVSQYNDNTGIVVNEGDVYVKHLAEEEDRFFKTPMFPGHDENRNISCVGIRGDEVWVGVQRNCNGFVCNDPYIKRWNTVTNLAATIVDQEMSGIPFTDNPTLIVRAIFTSSKGRTFIGLNLGIGFAVAENANPAFKENWTLVNSQNSPFPKGAVVNYNAISEVNGEIWIGTTAGLLVYDGEGPLTECSSYTLYNTSNGLPSNNVTDIAYDAARKEIWITSAAGVSLVTKTFNIQGRIVNVFYGRYGRELQPKAITRPLAGVRVELLSHSNIPITEVITGQSGNFSLPRSIAGERFKVRITYKDFVYEYSDVAPNSFLGEIYIPDSLMQDLAKLKDSIKQREFSLNAAIPEFIATIWKPKPTKWDGFDIESFDNLFLGEKGLITHDHRQWVENLALYYLTLVSVNDVGILATNLVNEGGGSLGEVIISVYETYDAFSKMSEFYKRMTLSGQITEAFRKEINIGLLEAAKSLKAASGYLYTEYVGNSIPESNKEFSTVFSTLISNGVDIAFDILGKVISPETEQVFDLKKFLIKQGSKFLGSLVGGTYYKYYTRSLHDGLVKDLALGVRLNRSDVTYRDMYIATYDKGILVERPTPSILAKATADYENALLKIQTSRDVATSTEFFENLTDGVGKLLTATGVGAVFGSAMRTFSVVLKSANTGNRLYATKLGLWDGTTLGGQSKAIVPISGLVSGAEAPLTEKKQSFKTLGTSGLDLVTLQFIGDLRALGVVVNGDYNASLMEKALQSFNRSHARYRAALDSASMLLRAKLEGAIGVIPGFDAAMDSLFLNHWSPLAETITALYFETFGLIGNTDRAFHQPVLSQYIGEAIRQSFSLNGALNNLLATFNEFNIPSQAYLAKTGFHDSTSYMPGLEGALYFTFTNIGDEAMEGVQLKMEQPVGGFSFTGPVQFQYPTILPGASVNIRVGYLSPVADTLGEFTLKAESTFGKVQDVTGVLSTSAPVNNLFPASVKPGLWSDPSIWSTGQVPTMESAVTIKHNVTVDIDATCKSLKAESPAQVQVSSGKKLTVLQ